MRQIRMMPVAVATLALTLTGGAAHAGWGHFGSYGSSGSSGSYGSYGSSGSSGASSGSYGRYSVSYSSYGSSGASYGSSGSSGGSSGHYGILARMRDRHQARHQAWRAARASSGGSSGYASSGGSSGYTSSYASSGGSSGSYGSYRAYSSYGSSGGSSGHSSSYGSSGGSSGGSHSVQYYSAPVVESYSVPTYESAPIYSEPAVESSHGESIMEAPVGDASYRQPQSSEEALLTIQVPADAEVFVNGSKTSSVGEQRQFVSRGLKPGYSYSYDVEIKHVVDGQLISESKVVRLRSGETRSLVYTAPVADAPAYVAAPETDADAVETVLTVNVPADAKVTLAGNATDADGTTRTFRTKQLQAGQVWNDYTVSVEIQRDGRTLSQEKTISLSAGSTPELNFDFADETVAMR